MGGWRAQAVEAREAGAAGVLGIVASVSGRGAPVCSSYAAALGLDAPVEVRGAHCQSILGDRMHALEHRWQRALCHLAGVCNARPWRGGGPAGGELGRFLVASRGARSAARGHPQL